MSRAPRVDEPNLIYHVLNRGNGRMTLFEGAADYAAFEGLLAEAREAAGIRLLAWCVMPDHWHLVVQPRAAGQLGRFAALLTQRHTQLWHRRHDSRGQGHLYQGRYKSFLVQEDEHFFAVCRYVERNALRAGLVERAADWRWGSLARLAGGRRQPRPDRWPLARPKHWVETVEAPESPAELEAVRLSVQRGRPFGDADWTSWIVARFPLASTLRPRGRPPRVAAPTD